LDPKALRVYIKKNPDKILREMGAVFGVSDIAILDRIKQLGITSKK
jgi:hypothetical protein